MCEPALPPALFDRLRRAVARLGRSRLRESYFTTFWLPRNGEPHHAVEEAVRALWPVAAPRGCSGAEWWLGRALPGRALPIEWHFDQDVKGARLRHPRWSSVFFLGAVQGGQLAVTEQVPDAQGRPVPAEPRRLETVEPRPNRYALFRGDRFHGVLPLGGSRMRVTLVVNYWAERPTGVPEWRETRIYRRLCEPRPAR